MTDWLALSLLFATYVVALVASGAALPVRALRPQFDPILPKPMRPTLRLLHGALPASEIEGVGAIAIQQRSSQRAS